MKKIYIAHSSDFDFKSELYKPLRNSELNSLYEITLPHENDQEPFESRKLLKSNCDLLIAEVSYPSTGLGIELGWANIYNVPVICIYKTGTKFSSALKTVSDTLIEYSNEKEMISKLKATIKKF